MKKEVCECAKILGRDKFCLHLTGCPESYTTKEYDRLPWWLKLLSVNPRKIYKIHKGY